MDWITDEMPVVGITVWCLMRLKSTGEIMEHELVYVNEEVCKWRTVSLLLDVGDAWDKQNRRLTIMVMAEARRLGSE